MADWDGNTEFPDYPYSDKQAAINDAGEVLEGLSRALRDRELMTATPTAAIEALAHDLQEVAGRHGIFKPID